MLIVYTGLKALRKYYLTPKIRKYHFLALFVDKVIHFFISKDNIILVMFHYALVYHRWNHF